MFRVSILLCTVTLLLVFVSSNHIKNVSVILFTFTGVLNASDLSRMEYSMSLKEENTVSMISMFYLHHAVENAVSSKQIYWMCLIALQEQ